MRLYKDLEEERTGWLQRVQATLYHQGVPVIASLTSAAGQARLTAAELSPAGRQAVEVGLRQLIGSPASWTRCAPSWPACSRRQPGCRALRTTHFGIGPITSVAIWAEMGDTRRFSSSDDAVRHTGLDITVYASDSKRARATSPAKGRPRCAGRCMRQPCAPPGRTRLTMPGSWRSSAGPTVTWA
ncbi:MAG: transposase [Acidimicrobiales bacterium]